MNAWPVAKLMSSSLSHTFSWTAFTASFLPILRPSLEVTFGNRHFYAAEAVESILMKQFISELQSFEYLSSVIWLHDGVWIPKTISYSSIRQVEKAMLNLFQLFGMEPVFQIRDLNDPWLTAVATLGTVLAGHLMGLREGKLMTLS